MAQPLASDAEIVGLLPERTPQAETVGSLLDRMPHCRQRSSSRCSKQGAIGLLLRAVVAGALLIVGLRSASQRTQISGGPLVQAWGVALAPVVANNSVADTQVKWATCVIDVHQAIFYLAQAGVFIKFATLDCHNATKREDKLACAADVSVAVNSFFWTASYVAATINSCQVVQSIDAACVAAVTGVMAELGEFAFVASSVAEVCEFEDDTDYWHYKEYYDKKHGVGNIGYYDKYLSITHQDKKEHEKKELEETPHDEKHRPKPYSAPTPKNTPKFPSPSEAAKFIAERAAKVKDIVAKLRHGKQLKAAGKLEQPWPAKAAPIRHLKNSEDVEKSRKPLEHLGDALHWMKPRIDGHPKEPEGPNGGKKPKAPEHEAEYGNAGDRMKLSALGQQHKPVGDHGQPQPKAQEHQTEHDNVGDRAKLPAWAQHSDQKKSKAPGHQAGVFDWMKPAALGNLAQHQGRDGHSEAMGPEQHQNTQGTAIDWMKLATPKYPKKAEQRADLTKAWEGLKHLKDGMNGMDVAAWLEHMKEAQELAKEKYDDEKTSERKNGEKSKNDEDSGENDDDGRRGARITQCVIDVNLGLSFLARAGLQIYALTKNCPSFEKDARKDCALDIFNVIASFAWGAQFLAQIAVDCPEIGRQGAACAAVVSDFVAIIAALGPLVNGIADDCPYYRGKYEGSLPPGYADFFGGAR